MEQWEASPKNNAITEPQCDGVGKPVERQLNSSGSDAKPTSVLTADGLGWPGMYFI